MSKSNSSNNDLNYIRKQKEIGTHLNLIFDEAEETIAIKNDKNNNWYILGPYVTVNSFYTLWKLATNYKFSFWEKIGLGLFKIGLLVLGCASLIEEKEYNFMKSFDEVWALLSSLAALLYFLIFSNYCWKSLLRILEFLCLSSFVTCLYLAFLDVLIYWKKNLKIIEVIFGWFLYGEITLKQTI